MQKIIKGKDFDPAYINAAPYSVHDVNPDNQTHLLKRSVFDQIEKANSILHQAREQARQIIQKAADIREEAIHYRESEKKKGYLEGFQKGQGEFTQKMIVAGQASEKVLKDAESQMIRMVMEIAEKVIGREVAEGAVIDVVKKAIQEASGDRITVRVHPDDVVVLQGKQSDLMSVLERTQSLSVKEDERLQRGGCVIETELGTVDAQLDLQLRSIRAALGLGTM